MTKYSIQEEIDKIANGIRRCRKCRLCESRKHAVPGKGPADAKMFFVGEAPGKDEDLSGRPFTGMSGVFLGGLLKQFDIKRSEVFITSSVKCRPPKNRPPKEDELKICKANWLDRQISLINPKIVVLLGTTAVKQVLSINEKLTRIHGRSYEKDGRIIFVTYHPASAMRFPKAKKFIKSDFEFLREIINNLQIRT